ncbi:type VI secretion system baseplate subunit TssG [Vibrio europaeus]|uniref:Type VI secretion protein VasB-1 n=1 Tax=Vibrio europaeus TaxID=300876 RepID=A0AAE7AW49_9VIBR|nr:type VI secretion system baseplate subunit TssG [Vibrio europaeus]MDC5806618.1 type VI secretion system baseplate subunit TssG [Vibrio europaeus]MDC5812935.1 type VI secretion system baseplate subunit TssG [Vibrio europaeus]MDC5824233.1 type VI secretion system baseplate subunit TssG [Vibrio europaeus]MDC5829988.1 type VI secretion system baseplate subunit TssG [Vibrio europaeus]MDC5836843.1 type VI secretion system baseplate subunit TssG [Vibrio europaeus]
MKVVNDLTNNAEKYDFAQAMRLLSHFISESEQRIRLVLKAEAMPTGDASEIQYFSLKNNNAKLRLAKQALSGVKGVIPYYIYEELLAALHDDDHALKDFLDVFNQRYFELVAQLETSPWLVVQNELHPEKSRLLNHIAALNDEHGNFFQYSFLLGQNSRNLSSLEQMLNDYFTYEIEVSTKHQERRQLPVDSLTKLGINRTYNSRIGQGFLIGKTCLTHFNHLVVSIKPANEQDLLDIQNDRMLASSMRELIQHYLRDNTQVSIYLKVKREYLSRPTLSSNINRAAKLGEVDCLAPERKPHQMISILLK